MSFSLQKEKAEHLLSMQNLKEVVMLPEKQQKAYGEFYDTARNNEILEPKTTLLVHMAAAMAQGCYP